MQKEESLEDLQKTFVDLFGEDLADMINGSNDPTVWKVACDAGSNARQAVPERKARV